MVARERRKGIPKLAEARKARGRMRASDRLMSKQRRAHRSNVRACVREEDTAALGACSEMPYKLAAEAPQWKAGGDFKVCRRERKMPERS